LRIVGWCLIALALYVLYASISTLIRHETPERSIPGIAVAPPVDSHDAILAKAKRQVAAGISSPLGKLFPADGFLPVPFSNSL
jgi:hypothetical protein